MIATYTFTLTADQIAGVLVLLFGLYLWARYR